MTAPLMPGATSVSALRVYPERAPDGIAGGSPHLHTVATEAYLVTAGRGELHAIDERGWSATRLEPGDTVWFSPGVIHRAVDLGGLEVRVVMSHAGLPEAGDAVLTFPDEVLADPARYAAAAALPGPETPDDQRRSAALARRDLAVEGYRALLTDDGAVDSDALERFHARAVALVQPRLELWRDLQHETTARLARETQARLDALAAGGGGALDAGRVARPRTQPAYGMCGELIKHTTQETS